MVRMASILRNYHIAFSRLDPALAPYAVKIANTLVKKGMYPEHVAVPLAINATKNWARLGWLESEH